MSHILLQKNLWDTPVGVGITFQVEPVLRIKEDRKGINRVGHFILKSKIIYKFSSAYMYMLQTKTFNNTLKLIDQVWSIDVFFLTTGLTF